MSQWFGGQGRKGDKATPGDSSEFSRGRAGRPTRPGNEPQVSRPGASRPQASRPQPRRAAQNFPPPNPAQDWNSNADLGDISDIYPDNRGLDNRAPDNRSGNRFPESRVSDNRVNQNHQQNQPYQEQQEYQEQQDYQNYQEHSDYENQETTVYGGDEQVQEEAPEQSEFKKRLVALIIDFLVFYVVACGVMLIPFLNAYLSVNLLLCLLLLFRDVLFQGRGIGKNLMGMQVIDARTGGEPTLKQAALRNIVLFGPYLAIQVIGLILHFIPIAIVNQVVITIVNAAGALYVIVVFPMEVHRAYTRQDGRRLGDELARTEVIDSNMDFSQPFPTSPRQ